MLGDKWVTSLGEWVNKLVFTHEVEYYSGKKKLLIHTKTWMFLKVMLSERS